jgi:hypothetical protein
MPTCRSLIQDACEEIGVGNPGETLQAADMQMGLRVLARMLNAWAADIMTLAVTDKVGYTIPSGTATVTIGPVGGDITRQRPVDIDALNYVIPGTSPEVEVPMGPMTDQQFEALSIKGLSSQYAVQYYYQTSVTSVLGTFTFWPVPAQDLGIYIYVDTAIQYDALVLTTDLKVPPGYQDGIHYDLAYRLCGPFGRPIPDGLPQLRDNALKVLKRPNEQPVLLSVDPALVAGTGGAYNVLSDLFTGSSGR